LVLKRKRNIRMMKIGVKKSGMIWFEYHAIPVETVNIEMPEMKVIIWLLPVKNSPVSS
jgi:hypothetical protein